MTFHQSLTGLQRRVLEHVINIDAPSRLELSRLMGLSPQTLTRAVRPLVDLGIVDERSEHDGGRGSPSRVLDFRSESLLAMGLVIAADRIGLTVEDLSGTRLMKLEQFADFSHPDQALSTAKAFIKEAIREIGGAERLVGMGVAVQGLFLEAGRRIVSTSDPVAWAQVDLGEYFSTIVDCPVIIQNDAKAIAVGTIRQQYDKRFGHYLCIFLASGIGGGLVQNGTLYAGARSNAGEIGLLVSKTDENRPTVPNFLKVAGIRQIEDWPGLQSVDAALREKVSNWCVRAGKLLSVPAQHVYVLMDVEAILVCSRLPSDILSAICAAVELTPFGSHLLGEETAKRLVSTPIILPIDETSLNRGACALAVNDFLRGRGNELDAEQSSSSGVRAMAPALSK